MRLRVRPALFLPAVLAVAASALVSPAAAAVTPTVTGVRIAGSGPGDLVRATGTGFAADTAVAVSLLDRAAVAVPLAEATSDADGTVTLPADTRVPASLAPGAYRVTMSQAGGTSARSSFVDVRPPLAALPATVRPGVPANLVGSTIRLEGLANGPDVVRTVTIDGVPTPTRWYSDATTFVSADIVVAVPSTLTVGPHEVTFTQTGPTPYTLRGTVAVLAPVITLSGPFAPTGAVGIRIANPGWDEDFDVTIVGAAGDVHSGLHYLVTPNGQGSTVTTTLPVSGLSVGTATLTAVSRRNGASADASFVVDGPTVTSPNGLAPGQRVVTADGRTELVMQTDGNLVQRADGRYAQWSSRTAGHPGARLSVQTDGNVVVRGTDGRALWNTGTAGIGAGARFGLDPTFGPTVSAATGRRAWSSFTPLGGELQTRLSAGGYLFKGQSLWADLARGPGGALLFTVGGDGNLVVRGDHQGVLWSSHTAGHTNAYLTLQTDGNLVLRSPAGAAIWANGVRGVAGARLVAQSDGNVVEYAPNGRALWSTRTHVS